MTPTLIGNSVELLIDVLLAYDNVTLMSYLVFHCDNITARRHAKSIIMSKSKDEVRFLPLLSRNTRDREYSSRQVIIVVNY